MRAVMCDTCNLELSDSSESGHDAQRELYGILPSKRVAT